MANRIPGLVVVGEDEQESSPIPGLIVFPGEKKKPSAIKELGRGFVEGLMSNPEAAGTIAKIAGAEEIGSAIEKKSRAIADKYRMPDELQGSVIENPSLLAKPAWWTHGIGQMAGSMVGPAGVGGGAFKVGSGILKKVISDPKTVAKAAKYIGVGAGGAAGGTMEGASTYNQVLEETGDEAKALRSGTLMAVGSAVLNSASFGSMLSPKTKSKLLHMVTAGITEGATEQAEEPWEAIVMNKPEEAAQRWLDGFNVFLPAMVTGGIGGLGGSVLTSDEKAEIRDALKKTSDLKKRTDIPGLVLESDEDSLDADEHSFLKSWLDEEDYVDFIERRKYEAQHDPAAMAAIEEEELLHQQARQPGAGAMLKDRLATEEANDFLRQEQENFDTLRRGLSQAERALGDIFGQVKSEDDADYVRLWENLDLTPVSDIIENKQEILTKRPDISPASLNDLIIKKQAEKLSRPIPEAPNPMQSEATRLGLEYVGVQEGGKVPLHLFTDPQNGSTFSVPEGESVDAALRGNRERFAPKTPVGETGDTTVQPKAEEATGGGKEQAAGVLEGEKEPWEMTRDEYDAHRISIINPEMGFEVTDTEIQSVGKAGGVQGQMQTKNKKIVRRKNADSGVTTHEIRHLIDEKHGIHNAVVQFINAAKGRSQQLREWLYSRGYIHAGRSGHFDTKELTEAVINEYLSDPAGMEKIVPELKSLLDLTDLTNYKDFNISHRQQIKKALSEGKTVPPEVLKDYPDLQQKAEPTPEVTPKATPEAGLEKSPEAKESSPSGNKIKPGWVEIKGKQRPFTTYREILRGKNKGMYRVSVGGKSYLVDKGKVRKWPGTEEVKTEERPARTDQIGDQYKAQQKAVQEPIKETDTFTDGMLPMQAKRVNDALDRSIRHNGKLTTRRALVKALVDDGAAIVEKNGERRLQRPNGNFLIEKDISKTAMDYADHLIKQKSRKQAIDKEVADLNIQVDAQKEITRESLKKDHPDWSAQRVEDELAKTVRAGEEAGVSEANERIGKPAVKRSLFEKKAVGAETVPSTAKHEPVSQKPKTVTESRQKKTPDLTATFPSSYSKTPREVLGKNSLWKVVSKDGKVVETEYATHPHILIVMDKKDRDAIGYQEKTPQGRDAVVSKEVVDSQLKAFKKRGTEVKTIEIAKYAERNDWGILSDGNIEVAVNPNFIGMVKRQHPNATFYLNGPEMPIAAFDGKEWKALIMPWRGTDFESVRKDAETIIEVPASAKVGKASSPPRPQGATVPKKQNVITGTIREKVDEAIKKAPEIDSDDLLRLDEIRDFKPSKWESADAGEKRVAEDREFYDSLKKKYGTIEITSPTGQGWKYNIINTKHHLGNFKKQIEKLEKGKEGIALFRKSDPTNTPAFKKWFGNSKVVDENGKPLVV
ncbi:MAG TPA: hypothetical protein PLT03_01770, partial [Bacillota bacterium]|nr:hypothetical protein [Bacillota bacterium]